MYVAIALRTMGEGLLRHALQALEADPTRITFI
jgi:hypothetical protein